MKASKCVKCGAEIKFGRFCGWHRCVPGCTPTPKVSSDELLPQPDYGPTPITPQFKKRSREDRLLYILRKASEAFDAGETQKCGDILRITLMMEEPE